MSPGPACVMNILNIHISRALKYVYLCEVLVFAQQQSSFNSFSDFDSDLRAPLSLELHLSVNSCFEQPVRPDFWAGGRKEVEVNG